MHGSWSVIAGLALLSGPVACLDGSGGRPPMRSGPSASSDTAEAMRLFEANIDAIHKRDLQHYLATYDHTAALVRDGAEGLRLGYDTWGGRTISHWPDSLIVRDMRVAPV